MSFVHVGYLPWLILAFIIFAILTLFFENRYFKWVKLYWFYKRSWISRAATFFYLAGVLFLLLALLDLRGKETRIRAQIPDQKTVILIDASMSMKAEDVRPSRFGRSLLLARHFVNKAVGHQISIVLFSERQKQIVAFTDDIDFLDARLGALETVNLDNAGTNLKQAVFESVQYLREESGDAENVLGNIVILSDGEENAGKLEMEVPAGINVAFVGVGTLQGAGIPNRSGSGNYTYFDSFKMSKGEKVITKLDEDFIRRFGNGIKNYRYWIASSYSMPTDEVISFLRDIHKMKTSHGDVRVQPVMYEYVVIPGVILLSIGLLLSLGRTFVVSLVVMFVLSFSSVKIFAQDQDDEKNNEKPLSPQTQKYLEQLKRGELDEQSKLKLGELLLKEGKSAAAEEIYKENKADKSEDVNAQFNFGTTYLKNGKLSQGVELLSTLRKKLENQPSPNNEQLIKAIDDNLALAFKVEKQKNDKQNQQENKDEKKEDKKDDKNEEKKDKNKEKNKGKDDKDQKNKKQNKNDKNEDKKNGKDKKDQKQDQSEGQKKSEQEQKDLEQKKKEKQEKENKDKENSEKDKADQEKQPKNLEEKEEQIKRQRQLQKIPAMLKQIMNEDRQLQERFLDTRTDDKKSNHEFKDW